MFHDTVAENLKVAKEDATEEELERAARAASIHELIMSLPDGYETKIAELGSSLSGGERQRLGIARAFLHDADILFLDEPTSNIDSLNEGMILRSLKEECADKTILMVSHRKMCIRDRHCTGRTPPGRQGKKEQQSAGLIFADGSVCG